MIQQLKKAIELVEKELARDKSLMEDKDIFYKLAKFNQLKIWENTPPDEQKKELKEFLKMVSVNKNNSK